MDKNYSYRLASWPLLRPSTKRFRTPFGVSLVPIYALGTLIEQREVKDCQFATWHCIIIRRWCICRCGLGAVLVLTRKSGPKTTYKLIHTWQTKRGRLSSLSTGTFEIAWSRAGRSLFTPAGLNCERRIISQVERHCNSCEVNSKTPKV